MCGIWFSAGLNATPKALDIIAHRGPDGAGWQAFSSSRGAVFMGHRRLAIIDLSAEGAQPMASNDGQFWITYNGEIYNYLELRAELQQHGCRFHTQSDTEVILAAYAVWGADCVRHFAGMFAFAIYEPAREQVFVARDHFGIKPLYYYATADGVAFASEIKQFGTLPGWQAQINIPRAYDFLMAGYINHTDESGFKHVRQLRGGQCAMLDLRRWRPGDALPVERWYHIPPSDSLEISESDAVEKFRALFVESVRIHLRADVTVGSCLSGGLDSSSIVCVMADLLRRQGKDSRIHTISSCFEEKSVDERFYIEAATAKARVKNTQVFPVWQDLPDAIEKITWHQDEPFGSTSVFAQWSVFKTAAAHNIKVMLDGQGADEQLAGYHGVFGTYMAMLLRQRRLLELAQTMLGRRRHHGQKLCQQLTGLLGAGAPRWLQYLARGKRTAQTADRLLKTENWQEADLSLPPYLAAMKRDGFAALDTIGQLCEVLTHTTCLPALLHFEDRNSMAHGIEARVPFLDHRLVDFNIALGSKYKVAGSTTKRILRRAMADFLPPEILHRQDKLGFPTPEEIWFKGPLRRTVLGWVEDSAAALPDLIDAGGLRSMAHAMLDGQRPFDFILWRFIHLGMWARRFNVSP